MGQVLFVDGVRSNSEIRDYNIDILEKNGFKNGGMYSQSAYLEITELKTKVNLVFGIRSNIGGSSTKYFSLVKSYDSVKKAMSDFKKIRKKLKTGQKK